MKATLWMQVVLIGWNSRNNIGQKRNHKPLHRKLSDWLTITISINEMTCYHCCIHHILHGDAHCRNMTYSQIPVKALSLKCTSFWLVETQATTEVKSAIINLTPEAVKVSDSLAITITIIDMTCYHFCIPSHLTGRCPLPSHNLL